jgi:hypothetical protein
MVARHFFLEVVDMAQVNDRQIVNEFSDNLGPQIDKVRFIWALLMGSESSLFNNIANGESVARGLFEILGDLTKEYDRIMVLAEEIDSEKGQLQVVES